MPNHFSQLPRILTPDQRVRVFISSTIEELRAERVAVRDAIRDLKLIPIMFEGGARPHPSRSLYRSYLEQSHIYIGIFWKSYGWIAPDMTVSGIEDEFNLSEGKPRLVYIKSAPEGREARLDGLLQRIRDQGTVCYTSFSSTDELDELVKNDVMQILSERFGLDVLSQRDQVTLPLYLQVLNSEMDRRGPVLQREDLINEIQAQIENERSMVLIGEPGIGKTYVLGVLGKKLNAIYLSLRNRSAQQVFSYIANHLSVRRDRFPENLPSDDEARAALQAELANSSEVLLIDDADQNPEVARQIRSLDFFNCQVIFATRSPQQDLFQGIREFRIPSLTHDQVEAFLTLYNITLAPGEFQRLFVSSQGNPLYLYYFTRYQISPLPDGLEQYQRSLSQGFSPLQQELVNFLAFSYGSLTVADLHSLLNMAQAGHSSIMETKHHLTTLTPIVHQVGEYYEFFHPYFEEHVCSIANRDGLSAHYHQMLADYAIKKQLNIAAAFHLIRAGDNRMRQFLVSGSSAAMLRGEWMLAEEFLHHEIRFAEEGDDKHAEAYARYLLSQVYFETGRFQDARREINTSIEIFGQFGENEWKKQAELWSSLLLIEEGQGDRTVETLRAALGETDGHDPFREAVLQLNLSYAYLQMSLFREGAEAARRSLDLFTELGDERGIYGSLTNLSGCVSHLGQDDLQLDYAQRIVTAASERDLPRLKAAGLNHLAVAQRHKNHPLAAQHSLEEAIAICQELGDVDAEVMNIANLGNTYLDRHQYRKAEQSYTEALTKAREHNLPRQEGLALELLGRLKHDRGMFAEAITLGMNALGIHQHFGERLRIASTSDYLARSYARLGRREEAAQSYEESGRLYATTGQWNDAAYKYDRAATLWNALGENERAFHCVSEGVKYALLSREPERASLILAELPQDIHNGQLGEQYRQTLDLLLQQPISTPFTHFMVNFAAYCKRQYDSLEKRSFESGLERLVGVLSKEPSANLLNAIAIGVEQADDRIHPSMEYDDIAGRIADAVDHLSYRKMPEGTRIWTIGLDWQRPIIVQIICAVQDLIVQRISMAIALILLANREAIDKAVTDLGGNLESGLSLHVVMQRDMEAIGMKLDSFPNREQISADFGGIEASDEAEQPQMILILLDDYELRADWAQNPDNKAFVWVVMNIFALVVAHCIHKDRTDIPELARMSREFCEAIPL